MKGGSDEGGSQPPGPTTTGDNTTPNGTAFTPGRYVRRLNAVEAELNVWKTKCLQLESRLTELDAWKEKVNGWLFENFGAEINSNGDGVTLNNGQHGSMHMTQFNNEICTTVFPVSPMLIPKSEEIEHSGSGDCQDMSYTDPVSLPLVSNKAKPVADKSPKKSTKNEKKKRTSNKSDEPVGLSVTASGSRSSSRTTPSSSKSIFIGSTSVTVEVTRTPSIELERCDKGSYPTTPPKSHLKKSTMSKEGNDGAANDDDDIAILYTSPSVPTSRKPFSYDSLVQVQPVIPAEVQSNDNVMDLFHMETNDPTPCAVCGVVNPEPRNEMLFCDKCSMCVHQGCYGVPYIEAGGWKCSPCNAGLDPSKIQCHFCPEYGGALKPIKSPAKCHWAHMICALWIPEVKPANDETLEPIINVNLIPKDRWNLKCSLCKNPRGACIQCQYNKRCVKAFHVTCAMRHGLEMKEVVDPLLGDLTLQAYCKAHTYQMPVSPKKKRRSSAKHGEASANKKKRTSSAKQTAGVESPSKKSKLMLDAIVVPSPPSMDNAKTTNTSVKSPSKGSSLSTM